MRKVRSVAQKDEMNGAIGFNETAAEHDIVFYIEVYEESSAYYLAARLQREHWDIQLIPNGSCWVCIAHAVATPDYETIQDLSDYLSDLSEFYGGSFKKWELQKP